MGLYEARSNIAKSTKDLATKWAFLKTHWRDAQSESIDKELFDKLERDVRTAVEAMDAMKGLLGSAKKDCSPASEF